MRKLRCPKPKRQFRRPRRPAGQSPQQLADERESDRPTNFGGWAWGARGSWK